MWMKLAAAAVLCTVAVSGWASGPEGSSDTSFPVFRFTTAEVRVTFTAIRANAQPVTDLSFSDFAVLRDGKPVGGIVSFATYRQAPLSALVLTDVSDSMLPGLPLERTATEWLKSHSDGTRDWLSFLEFGAEVAPGKAAFFHHMTSMYDVLLEVMPRVLGHGEGRRALILLTDGYDNFSYHDLSDVIATAQRNDIAIYAITAHPSRKQYFCPEVLRQLSEQTGGRYFEVRKANELLRALWKIDDELRNGYELVFRPGVADRGFHRLSIRSARPGMHFYYRSAYFQPATTAEVAVGK